MQFDLGNTLEVLKATPATLKALLGGLSEDWIRSDEGADTFSPYDIVGHLIHGEESDWIPRLRIMLEHGESRPFQPFDRLAMREPGRQLPLPDLLERFADLRTRNLRTLEGLHLGENELARTGTHPELGRVTVKQLLATWAVHDLGHLAQAARVMARAYTGEVGPWREYLPVLTR